MAKYLKVISFLREFRRFKKMAGEAKDRFTLKWKDCYPCLLDKTENTSFDRHYVYHTSWAARLLFQIKPEVHIDIASDLRFVTLVSAFITIKHYDYRPPNLELSNFYSGYADLLNLPFGDSSIQSISCMHVVEHVGLGRYGDPLDYDGDLKAMAELNRVLADGGELLFVVPIGKPMILFNAHRIYSYDQINEYFSDLKLREFSLIPDNTTGGFIKNASRELANSQKYGCGCFWFTK